MRSLKFSLSRPRSAAKCFRILGKPAKVGDQARGEVPHSVKNKSETLLQDWQKQEDGNIWTPIFGFFSESPL
jgi:hypothetical protein